MKEQTALAAYKIKLNELIENDCQCPICNEVIFKVCFIYLFCYYSYTFKKNYCILYYIL